MLSSMTERQASDLVIFAGPHGSGKDTLEGLFRHGNAHATRLVRYSTRRQAPGEENGGDVSLHLQLHSVLIYKSNLPITNFFEDFLHCFY